MRGMGRSRTKSALLLAGLVCTLSACAIGSPATITSAQGRVSSVTSVELLSEADETALRSQFASELRRSFGARAVGLDQKAAFVADFAVSQRPAKYGLQAISQNPDEEQTPPSGFKARWYDKCEPSRVSASLVIYSRNSGTVEAKSAGEFVTCPGDLAQLSDLAQLLVDRALQN